MEMEDFGYPPVFHETEDEVKVMIDADGEPVIKDKAKGKKVVGFFIN